ncbi:MAG: hypothetical protein KBF65_02080 [Rubrivivax sp.]|jgi:hypothetical protein|nr:hypothetical protein [Betaproteobacteria bacterium]MBP6320261.1 hypothetical protein [Rubrivivax sp.]MBK7277677.1 hypothetical protein [Betaproteobacteria bacterium]MBK8862556.1 hypothetical protein [Betaproteobacteria bacterium]MBK9685215.1 hypothetical protein [Betaproteobacteria bacterium]
MKTRLGQQRLLALFAAGLLAFNFPLLALWDVDATLWGLPLFPAALFVIWALLIAVLGVISESIAD